MMNTALVLKNENTYNTVAQGLGVDQEGFEAHVQNLEQAFRNTYDLYLKTLFYHWNFKGTSFMVIHTFLEEQYMLLASTLDSQAERLRMLGVKSRLPQRVGEPHIQLSDDVPPHDDLLTILRDDHYTIAKHLRQSIQTANNVNDTVSTDLLTRTLEQHEKAACFCEVGRSDQ